MPSFLSTVTLAALALSAAARPAPSPVQPQRRATPTAKPVAPVYAEQDAKIVSMINAMAAAAKASAAVKATRRSLDDFVDVDVQRRDVGGDTLMERDTAASCLDSTATDTTINALFYYGGAGTTVSLCPGATINLQAPIFFTAEGQVLTTQGQPTGDTRATISVQGADQSCAIYGACDSCSNVVVENIQVAGNRDTLGRIVTGVGLLEMGGDTKGQIVRNSHIYEPRGWSALHAIEGYQNSCSSMQILNNQVGPSGWSPTMADGAQFKKRALGNDEPEGLAPSQWADGISLACSHSTVSGNTVKDCTDGGIVIFGALGSTISGNTIIAQNRRPLGGINAVDYSPYAGSYEGTVVEGNTLIADTNMIKVGIALGGMSWGSDNRTASRTFGGTFRNNVFKSGSTGFFGYAISVAGHNNALVYGNDASGAKFGGDPSGACIPNPLVPTSQAFVYDQWTTPGSQLQNNFANFPLVFLICQDPTEIIVNTGVAPATGMITSGANIVAVASSASTTTTTTTTTTVASTTTTTTVAPTTTTTTTSTKAAATTAARVNWYVANGKNTNNKKTTTTTTTTTTTKAAAKTSSTKVKWYAAPVKTKRAIAGPTRTIIQDGDEVVEKRAIGASKATPVASFVNPFEALEAVARLR